MPNVRLILLVLCCPLLAESLFATEIQHTIGADAYVRGYNKDYKANGTSINQGVAQRIAVKVDLTVDKKTKIKTQTILSGDNWKGDSADQAVTGNSDNGAGGNPVRLDYGYIETVLPGDVIMRAGRTTANFSDCFNTCDDRRDRFLLMKFYGKFVPVILYDKRVEGSIDVANDDRDMYAAALFHLDKVHEWALLYATWLSKNPNDLLQEVHNFSPYYKYKGDKLNLLVVYNWLGQGANNSLFYHHHHSYAVKAEYQLLPSLKIGGQAIRSIDGGLIAGGYDTYSFVVNNDPDHNKSNTKLVSIGGLGTFTGDKVDDEYFYVGRLSYSVTKDTTLHAVTGLAKETVSLQDNDLMIYDVQLEHQYTKAVSFKGGLAWVTRDREEKASIFQINAKF